MPHVFPQQEQGFKVERQRRCAALIGVEEKICGIPVISLTPELFDRLTVLGSPFLCGGAVTIADMLQLLSVIAPALELTSIERMELWFRENLVALDYVEMADEIAEYFNAIFMDESHGAAQTPYYPFSVSLAHQMAKEPYRWDVERTRTTPIRVIFQYLRAEAKAHGCPLQNKISDAGVSAGLLEIDRLRAEGKWSQEDQDRINGVTR